jgi:hypothetical protein
LPCAPRRVIATAPHFAANSTAPTGEWPLPSAKAVRVDERPWELDRDVALLLAGYGERAALAPHRGDDHVRLRVDQTRLVRLARVAPAAHECIELYARLDEGRQLAGRGDESPALPRGAQRIRIARAEVDGVRVGQLGPRKRIGAVRVQLVPHERDRPLAVLVQVGERPSLRLVARRRVDTAAEPLERCERLLPERVVPHRHEKVDVGAEPDQLPDRDRSAAGRLFPGVRRGDDLTLRGHTLDLRESNPFHVTDDRSPHNFDPLRVREDDGSRAGSTVRIFL